LRAIVDARAPVRLTVDRATVRRGDSVTVTLAVPAATRAILWTRGPGEPWRPAPVALDSFGRATRRIGPLESDLYLRASSGSRRSVARRVSVALAAFVAGLELTARYPEYLARPDEPLVPGPDLVPIPEGTVILTSGTASVSLAAAAWRRGGAGVGEGRARLTVHGARFSGRLAAPPSASGTWRLELATADGTTPPRPALTWGGARRSRCGCRASRSCAPRPARLRGTSPARRTRSRRRNASWGRGHGISRSSAPATRPGHAAPRTGGTDRFPS